MKRQEMTIGRLSKASGVKIETIRFYEKTGLMPKPARSAGGHRLYDERHAARLNFIRRARALGFSLDDIRSLLRMEDQSCACADVHALTIRHLENVREKIRALRRLERTLAGIAGACARGDEPACPVIAALSDKNRA